MQGTMPRVWPLSTADVLGVPIPHHHALQTTFHLFQLLFHGLDFHVHLVHLLFKIHDNTL
jgi:hypothetical protein